MSLLDSVSLPPAVVDSIDRYGINPIGVPIEVGDRPTSGVVAEQSVVLAGTSNYLGLTMDPDCVAAAVAATQRYGTGTTGSRMANGTYPAHRELERALADTFGARSAVVFTTGYQANLGVIAGLAGAGDAVVVDADSHASIYDGARLSGAQVFRFKHNSAEHLDRRLTQLGALAGRALVVVEGIYSMMGRSRSVARDRARRPQAWRAAAGRRSALLWCDRTCGFGSS